MIRQLFGQTKSSMRLASLQESVNPIVETLESRLLMSSTALQINPVTHLGFESQAIQMGTTSSTQTSSIASTFASSYDLRNVNGVNYMTSVKNQGSCGSCWTFATMASIESNILKAGGPALDLSENNLKDYHGFDWGPCDGGNSWISEAYLSRLSGPVSEAQDPYRAYDDRVAPTPSYAPQYYIREMLRYDTTAEIKNALMSQGALYTTMNWVSTAYNSADATYYYAGTGGNHAVTIAGWDDTKVTAGGTGAWLCKNSWGSSWGNAGYFWVSYADGAACKTAEAFTGAVAASTYSHDYFYDTFGDVGELNVSFAMNAFTASATESLKSVGFFTMTDNASYTIKVYDSFTGGLLSAQLASVSGTETTAGWHTVDLSSMVKLTAGDSFYVTMQLTNGGSYPMAIDYRASGYNSTSTASAGQSFYSFNGTNWTDLTSFDSTANFCIKALTTTSDSGNVTPAPAPAPAPVPTTGNFGGTLFNDANGNGTRDEGEGALANWTVYIDANKNGKRDAGERTTLTDANGNYAFNNLASGTYRVRAVNQTGWWQSSPTVGYDDVTVVVGQTVTGKSFGFSKYTSISGNVFNDANGSGAREYGEGTVGKGWTIFLDTNGNGVKDASEKYTTTDAYGNYSFKNLQAGTYNVKVVLKSGWYFTNPTTGTSTVTVTNGQTSATNFGAAQYSTISGKVFNDVNRNGKVDRTDAGMANWRVFIDTNNNGVLDQGEVSVLTDRNGNWSFGNLKAGNYTIRVAQPTNYACTNFVGGGFSYRLNSGWKVTAQFGERKLY